jgi:hypothetical protein
MREPRAPKVAGVKGSPFKQAVLKHCGRCSTCWRRAHDPASVRIFVCTQATA